MAQSYGLPYNILGLLFYVFTATNFTGNPKPYKIAYLGAIISYGIVTYKTHGMPKLDPAYRQRILMDENFHYFMLATYWFYSNPIEVTLIPYATYSVFHALGYIRSHIIPTVFPTPRVPTGTNAPVTWQVKTQQKIKSWTDTYHAPAIKFATSTEVEIILPRILLGIFRLRLGQILVYVQFLRHRHRSSSNPLQILVDLRMYLDRVLLPPTAHPLVPPFITRLYTSAKAMLG
ncbi:hypothetical protein BJ944DRAFT_165841 [Cunninghamella echinulata]|nr:hypothetical protein BJ944DRAFT_165841 [Cunninghamella echinulata]